MPTYSYRCSKCERTFESFHSMSNTDPQYCPDCGAVGTKLLSASSVIFKGSGFYSTDYRDSGYLEAKKKGEEGSKKGEEGSKKGEEGSKKGEEGSKKGEEGSKKGEEGSKKGEEGSKKGEEGSKKGEEGSK